MRRDILENLVDNERMLVTNPGDSYTLSYELPDEGRYQIYLETQGYYVEWMREEWRREENPDMVKLMINHPRKYLNKLAPKYKQIEGEMEEIFWESKFRNIDF